MVDTEVSTQIASEESMLRIPGYQLEKLIGGGAMASVFLAVQLSLERKVALKLMSTSLVADATFCERFLKEGKIVAQLSHPNIITVYDIGVHQNCYYMAMEYVAGGTLKERIRQGLPLTQAFEILCQVADALGYAHKHHFVHRDVKPVNVLFREANKAVLSDFGIAKTLTGGTQLTAVGWTMGTPHYMSPEQALGKPLDARSDLYSLGIVFYEMLTGERPYHSADSFSLALMHVNNPVPRLPEQFAEYQVIIDGLLAKNPDHRFASAERLIEAIGKIHAKAKEPSPCASKKATQIVASDFTKASAPKRQSLLRWLFIVLFLSVVGGILYGLRQVIPESSFFTDNPVSVTTLPTPSLKTPQTAEPSHSSESTPNASDEKTSIDKAKVSEDIAILLKVAEGHRDIGYLTEPPGMNAAETYRRILQLDPDNTQAKAGLKALADEYAKLAKESLQIGKDPSVSRKLVETGLAVAPKHPELLRLREQLNQ